jgi:hypothetical protein
MPSRSVRQRIKAGNDKFKSPTRKTDAWGTQFIPSLGVRATRHGFGRVGVWRFLRSMTEGLTRVDLVHQRRDLDQEPPPPRKPRGMEHPAVTQFEKNVPSPPRKTRDGKASTKPCSLLAIGLVEAARSGGGQVFVLSRTKRSHYQHFVSMILPLTDPPKRLTIAR